MVLEALGRDVLVRCNLWFSFTLCSFAKCVTLVTAWYRARLARAEAGKMRRALEAYTGSRLSLKSSTLFLGLSLSLLLHPCLLLFVHSTALSTRLSREGDTGNCLTTFKSLARQQAAAAHTSPPPPFTFSPFSTSTST